MHNKTVLKAVSLILSLTIFLSVFTIAASADETEVSDPGSRIAEIAKSQIGYRESYNKRGQEVTKYGNALNYTGAWCGAFISWCARQAGVNEKVFPNETSSTSFKNYYNSIGRYYLSKYYGGSYTPKVGDIAFFTSYDGNRSKNNICHVGLVTEVYSTYVMTVEGNCPDSVQQRKRKFADNYLVGFATPEYAYVTGNYESNSDELALRAGGTLNSNILYYVPRGTVLEVTAINGSYGKTVFNGTEGWVLLDYCKYTTKTATPDTSGGNAPGGNIYPPESSEPTVTYTQYKLLEGTNFRKDHSTKADKIVTIPAGEIVNVTETFTDSEYTWGKTTYNGNEGWLVLDWCEEYSSPVSKVPHEVDWLVMDISYSQNPDSLDWVELRKEGVKGAILRIGGRGYGDAKTIFSDTAFLEHYKAAKAAGMYVGVYFFSYALTKEQAIEEANLTLDILKTNNCKLDLPVYIDIEDYTDDKVKQHEKAGKAVCTMVVDEFCKTVENAGYYAGIYCNKSFAEDFLDASVFNGRSTWIAQWPQDYESNDFECTYEGQVDVWQYTDRGRLTGAGNQNIDLNRMYIDYPSRINVSMFEDGLIEVGDINFDGCVSAADSRLALRNAVNLEDLTPLQKKLADINEDGSVTSADARDILLKAIN